MTFGLNGLRGIRLAQLEIQKCTSCFWRQDIRGLATTSVNGRPAGLIDSRVADSDIGSAERKVALPLPEVSLRALQFDGEPPIDYSRYAVVMWVDEWGRMGSWTLIASQDGVWGKPGRIALKHFPIDPNGEGWLVEAEVKSILSKSKLFDQWFSFWRSK